MSSNPALELSHVSKRYDSTIALDDVAFSVRRGSVHALLGENGAGKTTLMRVAYGMVRADSGSILVDGRASRVASPLDAIAAGIGMVHQHFTLVPAMTVGENIALGGHGRLDLGTVRRSVAAVSEQTGFVLEHDALVGSLSVSAQQRVEIAKALSRRATTLILDEPTAVLAPQEIESLLEWIRRFARAGNAVVLITHKLREALSVADDVTVLRRGRVAYTSPVSSTTTSDLTRAMIGAEPPRVRLRAASHAPDAEVLLSAERVCVSEQGGRMVIRDATLEVRRGEILGVVAVEGSGQHALLRVLAGRVAPASGRLMRPAVVGFVPEDRHRDAVLLSRTLTENVALRDAGARQGVVRWDGLHERTTALMQAFDVRAAHAEVPLGALSGGNQQKLVMARELGDEGGDRISALVVENPTRGLDVRATADIHGRLREAADYGAAVVVYSSDLDEVLTLASRVVVVFNGTVRSVAMDRERIGRVMLGLD